MNSEEEAVIGELTKNLALNTEPDEHKLAKLIKRYGAILPADYLDFISKHDGADGDMGDNYMSIHAISDVLDVAEASTDEPISQFLVVASTGYFCYGVKASVFYELDRYEDDYKVELGASFAEFLRNFSVRNWEHD